jgi:hypothetical protein
MNVTAPAPGNNDVRPASRTRNCRDTDCNWRTWPWVNARRNSPTVEGAYTEPNSCAIPPCRTTSKSSIESAPATMPATIVATLSAALDPLWDGTCSRCPTMPCSSHDCASRITGGNPAHDTRFGSSKEARTAPAVWSNLTREVPSQLVDQSLKNFDLPSSEGIIASDPPQSGRSHPWIKA